MRLGIILHHHAVILAFRIKVHHGLNRLTPARLHGRLLLLQHFFGTSSQVGCEVA